MRHIGSLIAGIVVAPLVWALLAFGLGDAAALTAKWQADNAYATLDLLEPLAFLAVAAVLFGLLATLRISPVGPIVAGGLYVLLTLSLVVVPLKVLPNIPDDYKLTGRVFDLRALLANGTLFVLGLALLMAAFSASRWRGAPGPGPADVDATPEEPTLTVPAFSAIPPSAGSPPSSGFGGDATTPLPAAPTVSPPDLWGASPSAYPSEPRHARPGEDQTR